MSEYPPGSTAKVYYDVDGNPTTLFRLIRSEPSWAMSRIIEGEKAIQSLERVLQFAAESGIAFRDDDADLITEGFRALPDDIQNAINQREDQIDKERNSK